MAANSATDSGTLSRASVTTANDNISLSLWLYLNATGRDHNIFENGITGGFGEGWGLNVSGSDNKLHIDVAFVVDITFTTALSASTWYHVVITRATTWTAYLNGVSDGTGTGVPFSIGGSDKTVLFGYNDSGSGVTASSSIRLANVGFWDRVITSTEISNLSSCSQVPSNLSSNLLVSLPLDNSGTFGTNGGSGGNFTTGGSLALADGPSQCTRTAGNFFPFFYP